MATLFLISQAITLFGSSVVQFSIIWYVTNQTTSGFWVGFLTVCAYVPQFLISLFSGVWADKYSKKALIIIADLFIAIATLALYFLFPSLNQKSILIALSAVSVLRSLGTGIQTPAVNSVIPTLVEESKLMKFNGINSTIQSLVQFAAPALAAAILSTSSLTQSLLIDISTAVVGIGLLACLPLKFDRKISASMLKDLKEGFTYISKNSYIAILLLIFGLFIFLCVPAGFLATLFVSRYYGNLYWYMGIVEIIGFIGMALGGLLIGTWGGFKNRMKTLVVGMFSFGLLALLMGAINNFVVYLILMGVYGIALTMVQTACTTLLQENTQQTYQGRVFGMFGSIYSGFLPLGMICFGPLADLVSLRSLMMISGLLLIIMAFAIFLRPSMYNHKA